MKSIIKGMTLLLAGASFVACSKDVAFDENAQKEAQIEQQIAQYEANFVKRFGSIAATQDWGFGDEAKGIILTRGESFEGSGRPVDCGFEVPNSITEHQNGNWANGAASQFANKGYTELDALYANYWVQHVNKPEKGGKADWIEAWDSSVTPGKWIRIAGFADGKNQNQLYFQTSSKTHGTTLMKNMGGAPCNDKDTYGAAAVGKYFRMKDNSGYHYDYKFLNYVKDGNTYLLVGFPSRKNNGASAGWWVVLIEEATQKLDVVEEGRIMCEDLGDADDFDFNDVVFDAKRFNNGTIEVTLIAAGGELPITVAGKDVHSLIGTMVNTGSNEGTTYTFTTTGSSIKNIPVVVYPEGTGVDAVKYELNAEIGKAPQKICTPRGSHYSEEKVRIDRAYSDFTTWVQNDNPAVYLWTENTNLTDLDLSTK